ncbi:MULTISPECIES: NUDIX domain-containing protein [Saccharothrix]|uniref:NUDIX domain-containing protein n=1 Tax=Saccharothrix TaxID=2071 RepID=UPI000939ACCE|nr:NUDIX domain-containing protein [Saccharothrix sp. CB00851]OKI19194.1 hypothetical protein A6A25_38985 [Saccharothrix sp. CB00851]
MTTTSPALGPLVAVYGLVGHDERLLLVRDSGTTARRLPGGLVPAGEPAEYALRRILWHQVNSHIAHLDFCAAVELPGHRGAGGEPEVYELALLFDVTLTDLSAIQAGHGEAHWVTNTELDHVDLRPTGLAERLHVGGLTGEHPWWPADS